MKKKWLINLIKENNNLEEEYELLIVVMYSYYYVYDMENKCNMHAVFKDLYINCYDAISIVMRNNISQSSLTRYKTKYDNVALMMISQISDFKKIKEWLIKSGYCSTSDA